MILATRVPQETAVTTALRELGLECQVIFNRGAVMVLPGGVLVRQAIESRDTLGTTVTVA